MSDHLKAVKTQSCLNILVLGSTGVTLTGSVCKKITSQLIGAMGKHDDVSVQLEALDILSDMLGR